jgi:hypothetical protein
MFACSFRAWRHLANVIFGVMTVVMRVTMGAMRMKIVVTKKQPVRRIYWHLQPTVALEKESTSTIHPKSLDLALRRVNRKSLLREKRL